MARGIDHLVLPVEELDIARGRYEALGFTVAPDARHPFGTENACVFFANRTYLEPLAVADRMKVEDNARKGLVFLRRFLAYRFRHGLDGFCMLAMKSESADADKARFDEAGFGDTPVFPFERKAVSSEGEKTIGVRLAYALDDTAPDATLFSCQHINTDFFWEPERTTHRNGATGVLEVVMTEDNPADFQYLLQAATDTRDDYASSFGLHFDLGANRISVLSPVAYRAMYGEEAPNLGRGLRLAAFLVGVESLNTVAALLDEGTVAFRKSGDMLIVPPVPGQGATVVFKENRT